ncbi:hypothetical protein TFLX_04045 [Thermoflexales bacterium]|nr:hypothetical protein TFLX_04045 [Thermoflexales bacterium]
MSDKPISRTPAVEMAARARLLLFNFLLSRAMASVLVCGVASNISCFIEQIGTRLGDLSILIRLNA